MLLADTWIIHEHFLVFFLNKRLEMMDRQSYWYCQRQIDRYKSMQWYIEVWLPGLITSVQVSILKRVQLIPLRLKWFKGGVDRLKRLKGNVDRGQVSTTSSTPPSQTFSDSSTNTWKRISVSLETSYIVIVSTTSYIIVGNTITTVGQCETDKPEQVLSKRGSSWWRWSFLASLFSSWSPPQRHRS